MKGLRFHFKRLFFICCLDLNVALRLPPMGNPNQFRLNETFGTFLYFHLGLNCFEKQPERFKKHTQPFFLAISSRFWCLFQKAPDSQVTFQRHCAVT